MSLENFNIILCPTAEQARQFEPDITVEAEYGNICIEGKDLTLAHHGDRSDNPAPCNAEVEPRDHGLIVISHIDLDTVGGVLACTGDKLYDPEFWKGAEHIDVYGSHHMHDLEPYVQDQLNAVYAWNSEQERVRYTEPTDVRDIIRENQQFLEKVIDRNHPEHEQVLERGREWERDVTRAVEERCVFENKHVRGFSTDGVFCSASYYSERQQEIIPCTVSYNEKFHSITVAFADGGRENGGEHSAREIVQHLWGPEAGGRDGIAGSPRGQEMTREDFDKAIDYCLDRIIERNQEREEIERAEKDMERDNPPR